ncbi:L-threonylcarbamoyladenylate synthase [Euzebya rosea]|uniref:L-threonylcarbamoyladenylate synthase n=1 Tax=Euzebya rosea TaxID=2052804 RepID=UPI000DF30F6B|nr:L-threonylcarbamoyladenylate synthase [Euzebya rosea]
MSTIISLSEDRDGALEKATETLQAGSVVVLPVGGVYAIVADAFRTAATQRIFAARRRSRVTPLPVLLRSERQVGALAGDVPDWADRLMAAYWPGDLTLVLPATVDLAWDLGNAKGTVQLRQPADEFVRDLIGAVGPLACTAANRLSQPRPTTVEEAKAQLGVLVPVYLDGGELDGRVSTIVDATGTSPVVHREGIVPEDHIHLVASGELEWGEKPDPSLLPVDAPEDQGEEGTAADHGTDAPGTGVPDSGEPDADQAHANGADTDEPGIDELGIDEPNIDEPNIEEIDDAAVTVESPEVESPEVESPANATHGGEAHDDRPEPPSS